MARRLLTSLATIAVAMTLTFVLIRQMPGDIVHQWAVQLQMQQGISYEQARLQAAAMINYNPDIGLFEQYFSYLGGLLTGNLGLSLTYRIPVSLVLVQALPWTLLVTTLATFLSFVVGCGLGLLGALRRQSLLDPLLTLYATLSQALPPFLIGLLLLLVFGIGLEWLPMRGNYTPDVEPGLNLPFLLDVALHAVMPVMAFALPAMGDWALAMKASATSVLGEDYLHVARARGLKPRRILLRYLGRNSMMPLVPSLATALGSALGGSMLVEAIFGYPGLGFFLAQAIDRRDYPLMQGIFLISTMGVVLFNLAGELVLARLDPRLRR
jgi:peptide/nickel transport system permease protein